jgi:transposase-like protein
MSRKVKYNKELKLKVVKKYLEGTAISELSRMYSVPNYSGKPILVWVNKFRVLGECAFETSKNNKSYSKELKTLVIKEYLSGADSLEGLANKYNISSAEIVRKWVLKYNNGIAIRDYDPKGDVYTMKSRKTSFEERLKIVKYVLDNNNDYKGTADKYGVPYTNVYNWVKKYLEHGEAGLSDLRGRPSSNTPKKELTVEEKQSLEIESLKAKIKRLELHNELLKKKMEYEDQMEKDFQNFVKSLNTKR